MSGITTSDKSISNFGGDEEEDNDNHDDDNYDQDLGANDGVF